MTKLSQTGIPSHQNVGNCKIEFFNGPTMDQIDQKWIKIFPKKSPKPFLRPNTWSCSAPFDRNNLKSWLLIYVHLKVTFQLQEFSPKFLFSVLLVPRPTGSGPLIPDNLQILANPNQSN